MTQGEIQEHQIIEDQLPSFARAFLEKCKREFDQNSFKFFGYTERELSYLNSSYPQYSVLCIGDSYRIVGHGLCLNKKKRGLFSFFGQDVRKSRMLQTLFTNGFRLITTDMHDGKYTPSASDGYSWNSVELKIPFPDMISGHRTLAAELVSSRGYEPFEVTSLQNYLEFPSKYKFPETKNYA